LALLWLGLAVHSQAPALRVEASQSPVTGRLQSRRRARAQYSAVRCLAGVFAGSPYRRDSVDVPVRADLRELAPKHHRQRRRSGGPRRHQGRIFTLPSCSNRFHCSLSFFLPKLYLKLAYLDPPAGRKGVSATSFRRVMLLLLLLVSMRHPSSLSSG
jgi:hypothetical protein